MTLVSSSEEGVSSLLPNVVRLPAQRRIRDIMRRLARMIVKSFSNTLAHVNHRIEHKVLRLWVSRGSIFFHSFHGPHAFFKSLCLTVCIMHASGHHRAPCLNFERWLADRRGTFHQWSQKSETCSLGGPR